MDTLETYRQAQDGFEAVLAAVPGDRWDLPSTCPGWTMRDVAGHVIWAQEQLRAWATDAPFTETAGAPGAPHPGVMASGDPLATWRTARAATDAVLSDEVLGKVTTITGLGDVPLSAVITLLVTDLLAHTWDIGHAAGLEVRTDPELIAGSLEWAHQNAVRMPGFFGPELTPPADADEQTRWLAFLGRAAWQPAHA